MMDDERICKANDHSYQDEVIANLENVIDAVWDDEPIDSSQISAMLNALDLLKALCPRLNQNEGDDE